MTLDSTTTTDQTPARVGFLDYSRRLIPPSFSFLDDSRPVSMGALIGCFLLVAISYSLLWTRYFYPLADSTLYLALARSIADGHGFMFMDIAYKRATPLHPLLLAGIMKLGGGIGAIHAANIVLILIAHVLCFMTIRRWFNDRMALLATLATAAQFWVFRNGMFVLTEPPFMVMVWAGLLPLAHLPAAVTPGKRWLLVLLGCLFLAGAFETRVASAFLLPGVTIALWLSNQHVPWMTRAKWVAVYVVVFTLLGLEFRRSPYPEGIAPTLVDRAARTELVRASMPAEERYTFQPLQGVRGGIVRKTFTMLLVGGRWINEAFVAPTVYFTRARSALLRIVGAVLAILALIFILLGWLVLLSRKAWWPVMLSSYAIPFWILWATRIIPRYLIPIAPAMFVMTALGMAMIVQMLLVELFKKQELGWKLIRQVPAICLTLIVLGNMGPYLIEVYVHKILPRDYYDVARQGGVGELIDIGGYLQKNAKPGDLLYTNSGMPQRVLFYLSGVKTDVPHEEGQKPRSMRVDTAGSDPRENSELRKFLSSIEPAARFAVIFSTLNPWPEWYFPLDPPPGTERSHWWFLYERDAKTGRFQHVEPPRDRDYASGIPVSKMVFPTSNPSPRF